MKSERRHELQHNELADWLIKTGEEIKPYMNMILAAAAVVLIALAAYSFWSRWTVSQNAEAWSELNAGLESRNLEVLAKVIEQRPGTRAAAVASVVSANYCLSRGCNQLFSNKAMGQRELNKAIELYAAGLAADQPSSLREQAAFGLARAKEAKGELDAAARQYRELLAGWPDGAFANEAKERLDYLQRHETKLMFEDFRHFDPKPVFAEAEGLAEPGQRPSADLGSLPDEPAKANLDGTSGERDTTQPANKKPEEKAQ